MTATRCLRRRSVDVGRCGPVCCSCGEEFVTENGSPCPQCGERPVDRQAVLEAEIHLPAGESLVVAAVRDGSGRWTPVDTYQGAVR